MAKYKIVTPVGASFTVAGGGYDYEMEALEGMDAEIVEVPADEDGFIRPRRGLRRGLREGNPVHQEDHRRAAAQLPRDRARLRRRGLASMSPPRPRAGCR